MEKRTRVGGIFVYILILILMLGIANTLLNRKGNVQMDYTNETLKREITEKQVVRVEIKQNSEVPTGTVLVVRNNGDLVFYTPNVSDTIRVLPHHHLLHDGTVCGCRRWRRSEQPSDELRQEPCKEGYKDRDHI